MMHAAPLLAPWLAIAACALAVPELVGREVPPYPAGYDSLTGTCVPTSEKVEDVCGRGLGSLERDGRTVAVLAQMKAGMQGDHARWRITDIVELPEPQPGEELVIGTCEAAGEADPGIAALVDGTRRDRDEWLQATRWARRLDRVSGRLVELEPAGVRCINEGFGEF